MEAQMYVGDKKRREELCKEWFSIRRDPTAEDLMVLGGGDIKAGLLAEERRRRPGLRSDRRLHVVITSYAVLESDIAAFTNPTQQEGKEWKYLAFEQGAEGHTLERMARDMDSLLTQIPLRFYNAQLLLPARRPLGREKQWLFYFVLHEWILRSNQVRDQIRAGGDENAPFDASSWFAQLIPLREEDLEHPEELVQAAEFWKRSLPPGEAPKLHPSLRGAMGAKFDEGLEKCFLISLFQRERKRMIAGALALHSSQRGGNELAGLLMRFTAAADRLL